MQRWLLFGLFCLPACIHAETIYKCVGAKGDLSYQSEPCPASARHAIARDYGSIHDDPAAERRAQQIQQEMDARSRESRQPFVNYGQINNGGGAYTQRDQLKANCAAARASRANVLERVGLNRTMQLLRDLDDNVNRACKGF